jgi:hypothetical protein
MSDGHSRGGRVSITSLEPAAGGKHVAMTVDLSEEEYRLLSDQKAADFRSFAQVNPGLLAVTGALFAAGLAKDSTTAVALSPIPLLLAVYQFVRNAELQVQLTTYLAVFGPAVQGRWERDVACVRESYYKDRYGRRPKVLRPSAWNVWILFAVLLTELLVAFPLMTGMTHGLRAFAVGSALNLIQGWWLMRTSGRIEKARTKWTGIWQGRRDELEES